MRAGAENRSPARSKKYQAHEAGSRLRVLQNFMEWFDDAV